jgi:tungstate transport system ATP-binding protein
VSLYRLEGVVRRYGGRTVLDLDELEIPEAGATVLQGPNGSGKTTLLDILAFLDPPDAGRVWFMGEEVRFSENRLHALRRHVVQVGQHPILFTASVYKNVEYGLKIRGAGKAERERAVAEALELVGMSDFISVRSHKLSGGETQRVAIARALACDPKVILFDEPTASVDVEHQAVIERIARDIAAEKQVSVIFSTHDYGLSRRLADRRVYLVGGRLAHPRQDNVFSVTIRGGQDGPADCLSGETLLARARTESRGGAAISMDMRELSLIGPADEPGEGVVHRGRIIRMADEGGGVRILVDAGRQFSIMTDKQRLGQLGLTIGDDARFIVPPEAVEVL